MRSRSGSVRVGLLVLVLTITSAACQAGSAHSAADATVEGLGTDVDALVTEMESLRQALEETSGTAHHGLAAGGATE